jgi:hypothetical protein
VTADGLRLATSINDLPEAEYFALGEEGSRLSAKSLGGRERRAHTHSLR